MQYFKIIKDVDMYSRTKHHHLIKDELYTPAEFNRLHRYWEIDKTYYEIVDYPKDQTGFIFGARFKLPIERGDI